MAGAILLLDWVSGPLKTGAAQFPRKENTSNQAVTLATFWEGWWETEGRASEGGWVGGGGWRDPACPNCRHSAAASITTAVGLFLQSLRLSAQTASPGWKPRLKAHWKGNGFLFVTLLQHLHSSFSPGAQPYGLTSAKCVLKRREGPFHRPHSSSPPLPPPRSSYTLPFTHLLAGWHCYHYTGRIYGVRAYGKNKKASVNTCGKHSVSPPPSTGAHSLIRYALIRHIDHRRDSTSPESSHRTFISNGAQQGQNIRRARTCKQRQRRRIVVKARERCQSVCRSVQLGPSTRSPVASVRACFSHLNNRKADR